jgi:hypothetical protein
MVVLVLGLASLLAKGFATAALTYQSAKRASNYYSRWPVIAAWSKSFVLKNHDLVRVVELPGQATLKTFAAFLLFGLTPFVTYVLAPTVSSRVDSKPNGRIASAS